MLQTSIEDLTDTIKQSKGTKSVAAYRDAYRMQKETDSNYLQMAMAQAGYHAATALGIIIGMVFPRHR